MDKVVQNFRSDPRCSKYIHHRKRRFFWHLLSYCLRCLYRTRDRFCLQAAETLVWNRVNIQDRRQANITINIADLCLKDVFVMAISYMLYSLRFLLRRFIFFHFYSKLVRSETGAFRSSFKWHISVVNVIK